jgi:hypothetical protein
VNGHQRQQRAEHRAIENARKVYNDALNGYSQRTALRRAFKKYEQEIARTALDCPAPQARSDNAS